MYFIAQHRAQTEVGMLKPLSGVICLEITSEASGYIPTIKVCLQLLIMENQPTQVQSRSAENRASRIDNSREREKENVLRCNLFPELTTA